MNTLLTSLAKHALASPQAIAVRSCDESLTYAQLMTAVRQVAQRLADCQASSLGIYLDNGIEWIVLDLAGIAAEIKVVPLPWFFSDEQLSHAIADGGVDFVAFADDLPAGIVGTGVVKELYGNCSLQPIVVSALRPARTKFNSGKLSFTSGSTGTPKGVELEHRFIDQTCRSVSKAISSLKIERHLSILPYATLLENIAGIYLPLTLGKTVYAEPAAGVGLSAELRLDPVRLQQTFNRIQPNSLILTPQLLELFCMLVENDVIDPACLVFVAVGGARVGESLMRRAKNARIPVYEGYGLTEFGSVAILNTPQDCRIGSVGKPLPGVTVELAADGEICLSTTLWQTDTDAQPVRTITVQTGDFGSIDNDGFIYVQGRKSNLIVLSTGRNVSPEWVETELNSSPLILQSYVFSETGSDLSALLVTNGLEVTNSAVDAEVERINFGLPAYAQIKHSHRLLYPFSRDNQMLTANGRLRRLQIEKALPTLLTIAKFESKGTGGYSPIHSVQEINPC
jgi:long-subunit acyl-CoA synthetase (AMP-forming)